MEILIQPKLTFFIFQEAFARRIHTDGAPMPESEPPAFQGYATGKWVDEDGDGRYDVLEVETRNFKGTACDGRDWSAIARGQRDHRQGTALSRQEQQGLSA